MAMRTLALSSLRNLGAMNESAAEEESNLA